MNFDEAIKSHSDWKMKLQRYLSNPDGSINAAQLSQDNLCVLGKWIHGDGKKYSHLDEYQQLLSAHKNFHKSASDIVIRRDRGEDVKADIALSGKSPYATHSSSVISLLMKMRQLCKN